MTDADEGLNSEVVFSFIDNDAADTGSNRFQINKETGDIISTASFLGQAGASFNLMVKATDRNGEGLTSTKMLLVSFTN